MASASQVAEALMGLTGGQDFRTRITQGQSIDWADLDRIIKAFEQYKVPLNSTNWEGFVTRLGSPF
jgi:hypothetical protein